MNEEKYEAKKDLVIIKAFSEAEIQRLKDSVQRLSLALELAGIHPDLVRKIADGSE